MRKRIIGALLVLMLFASVICVSAVSAADTTQIKFGEVSVKPGEQVEVPVTITGNPGIAGFRFWVEYDMEALTLVSVEKGDALTSGTLKFNVDSVDTTITWFALTDVTGNGELMTLTFDVSENAIGDYPLTVTYDPEDIVNASWQQVDCTVADGKIMVENLSGLQYVVENDQVTITGYTGNGGDLVIPASIGGLPVTKIGDYAFWYCTSLTSVAIPDSVTSVGPGAFMDCTNLTAVYISDIASWCNISFYYSSSNPLYYAEKLYLNGNLVTELAIPDGVTSVGANAFYNCTSLTSVTIPDSVTSMGDCAFEDCTSLTSITIPDSVTSFGANVFCGCAIQKLIVADGSKTVNVRMVVCSSTLQEVVIPDSVTSIGDSAFYNCSSLTSVTLGNGVTSIGAEAFYYCTSLRSITIPDSVTTIGEKAFDLCPIVKLIVADGSKTVNSNMVVHKSTIKEVVIPNSVTTIGSNAFYNCSSLTSITIPDSVTSIGDYAFYSCDSLTSITIPDSVTSIGDFAFAYCSSLTSITIPDSVTSIKQRAFENCTELVCVIYCGTLEQWNAVSIGENNKPLTDATLRLHNIENGACSICEYKPLYTVIFKDEDGTELSKQTYHYGDTITIPTNPTKVADNMHTYTFTGWDNDFIFIGWDNDDVVVCMGDATYTATYSSDYISYTVVFKDWDGTIIPNNAYNTYYWGEPITVPTNPTRAADNTYTYAFNGWDKPVVNCAGDATYTATYTPTYIDYTVTFKNWDGSVLDSNQYHYNDTVTPPSATPTKPEDNTYKYVFKGWDSEIVKVIGNKIYTAVYDAIKKIVEITSNVFNVQGSSIGKVGTGTSINTFVSKLSQSGSVKVYKGNTQVSGNTAIGTGMEVKLMDGNTVVKSYTVVVTGDTNGDGAISVTDMIAVKAHVLKKTSLTGAYAEAADTSNDNAISITDFIQIKAQILGKSSIVPN